jgi:hypothetical protein
VNSQDQPIVQPPVQIEPPLRGEWAIMSPPGHPGTAFDFLATKGRKLPYRAKDLFRHIFSSISLEDTYAWGQPVYAPLDSVVAACGDGIPDRMRISMVRDLISLLLFRPEAGSPFSAYGGNYIVLKCSDIYPLLAHLRCGSLRVHTGDHVRAGEQLAEVGNSGSSIQPHLHFQIMDSEDPFPLFRNLVPFRIRSAQKRTGREWKVIANTDLSNGDHLRL